jgi:hypothetical protein
MHECQSHLIEWPDKEKGKGTAAVRAAQDAFEVVMEI